LHFDWKPQAGQSKTEEQTPQSPQPTAEQTFKELQLGGLGFEGFSLRNGNECGGPSFEGEQIITGGMQPACE